MNTAGIAENGDRPTSCSEGRCTLRPPVDHFSLCPMHRPSIDSEHLHSRGWAGNGVGSQPISASDGEGSGYGGHQLDRGRHVLQARALYIVRHQAPQTVFTNPQVPWLQRAFIPRSSCGLYAGLDSSYRQGEY